MRRILVLFAREPTREAREKGFVAPEAIELFARFADGWRAAALEEGAHLVVAAPPEDLPAWRRRFAGSTHCLWIQQRGASLGERLEDAARCAASLGGHVLIVGGDVAPSTAHLSAAFGALERGEDAVLGPAPDGGVSLVGLAREDLDLLRRLAPRRKDAFAVLHSGLLARGRRVELTPMTPDVDGRRGLRALLPIFARSLILLLLARRALMQRPFGLVPSPIRRSRLTIDGSPPLRGPPASA